jgi:hypothetical protein
VPRRDDAGVISALLAALATLAFSKLWLVVVLPMDARAAEHARIVASLRSTLDVLAAGDPQRRLELPLRLDLAPAALQCCMSLGAVGPEHVTVQLIERLCMDGLGLLRPLLADEPNRYDNLDELCNHSRRDGVP